MTETQKKMMQKLGIRSLKLETATNAELEDAIVELAQNQADLEDAIVELAELISEV